MKTKKMIACTLVALGALFIMVSSGTGSAEAQPLAGFCCDSNGNRRCVLANAVPAGNPCWCFGQGSGYTCY